MRRRGLLSAVTFAWVVVMCAACGESASDTPSASVRLVAGGGDERQGGTAESVQLEGTVSDIAVDDDTVHVLLYDGDDVLVTVDPDGAVSRTPLEGAVDVRHLTSGPDGTVYAAGQDAVYEVEDGVLVTRVVASDAGAPADDGVALPEGLSVAGVAVDGEGRLVVSATFIGSGPDEGSEPVMTKVFRLEGDELEHVAGADSADLDGDELDELLASPPSDMKAMDVPLDGYGTQGELATGQDGAVYVAGPSSVLRLEPGGGVEAVLTDGERAFPDEPYGDAGDASGFGGSWVGSDIAVEGDTVAVVDSAVGLEQERVDVEPFAWGDDLGEPAQAVADRIVRGLGSDDEVGSDDDTAAYGQAAVLVHDGRAATATTQVTNVALDDDRLYVTGETSEAGPGSEVLIVSMPVPDEWR